MPVEKLYNIHMKERIESEIARNLKAATKITFIAGREVVKKTHPVVKTLLTRRMGEVLDRQACR